MERQASLGDSWVLPYALSSRFTPEEQRWFLDRCADQGVKVMVPLASTVGSNTRNLDPWIHRRRVAGLGENPNNPHHNWTSRDASDRLVCDHTGEGQYLDRVEPFSRSGLLHLR